MFRPGPWLSHYSYIALVRFGFAFLGSDLLVSCRWLLSCGRWLMSWVWGRLFVCPFVDLSIFPSFSVWGLCYYSLLYKILGWYRDCFCCSLSILVIHYTGFFCYPMSKLVHRRSAAFNGSVYSVKDWPCLDSPCVLARCGLLYRSRFAPFLFSVIILYISCPSFGTMLSVWTVLTENVPFCILF